MYERVKREEAAGFSRHFLAAAYYAKMYRDRLDKEFYVNIAKASGGPVLEIGSGDGRLLTAIAESGVRVFGIDISAHMVRLAKRRLAGLPDWVSENADIVQADSRRFELNRQFASAFMPFRMMQHLLTPKDQRACLRRIHRHLRPGGVLALDVFRPREETGPFPRQTQRDPKLVLACGTQLQRSYRKLSYDHANHCFDIEVVFKETPI